MIGNKVANKLLEVQKIHNETIQKQLQIEHGEEIPKGRYRGKTENYR